MAFLGKVCKYCDPLPVNSWHLPEQLEKFVLSAAVIFRSLDSFISKRNPTLMYIGRSSTIGGILRFLLSSGLPREVVVKESDQSISNRTLVFASEAASRGIIVKALKLFGKRDTNLFSMQIRGRKIFFEGLPTTEISQNPDVDLDDKYELKKILKAGNIPYAQGECFWRVKSALSYGRRIGFPLVVKPRQGSLSRHTTCNIQSEQQLERAVRIAKIISKEVVVEKYIPGQVYRITLVGHKMSACCLREPPNIVGDGVHTVAQLAEIKNSHPWRGEAGAKNYTLHKIQITPTSLALLKSQGLSLDSIPEKGRKVYLHTKVILACGADIHDQTRTVHPENIALFEKLSRLCKRPLIGVDFICRDITIPYHQQECAVIEVNTLPYIDMHHYPVSGEPQNVAGCIVDYLSGNLV